jgi:hypothetical protein
VAAAAVFFVEADFRVADDLAAFDFAAAGGAGTSRTFSRNRPV